MELSKRVSLETKLVFTKHLAIMLKSGIAISETLESLNDQTQSSYFEKVLGEVANDVQNGKSLTQAFGKHPKVFDKFYVSLIEVGEEGGTLTQNLDFLSDQLANENALRKKIQGAMIYPLIIMGMLGGLGTFVSLFILPKLSTFFEAFDVELPITTQILLFVANTMKDYGIYIFGGLAVFIIGFNLLIKTPSIKPIWHSVILKIPLFGRLITYTQIARFSRNLGLLLKSGVPVSKSIKTAGRTVSNLKFEKDLEALAIGLEQGTSMGDSLDKYKFSEFPPIVCKMISVGERTGKLEETLTYVSDYYQDEIDNVAKNLSNILEPALLLTMGLAVGFMALAIITPIYQLTGSIGR